MINVKISVGWHRLKKGIPPYKNGLSIYNFTNTKNNIFNNKKYFINQHVENPDYWFILENTKSNKVEEVCINPENIFFLNSETRYEPSYFMKNSKRKFLEQFSEIYSPNFINMINAINCPPFLAWKLRGDPFDDFFESSDLEFYQNYKPKKTKLLSVFCTNKEITEIQKVRIDFVKKLKNILGDDMDWFGDENKTETKIEGISSYKYHLVLENQIGYNFISEKLFDSYLGSAFPIYSGAPNISDYFPNDSYKYINLNSFSDSIDTIKQILNSNDYENSIDNIKKSKEIALEDFNLIKRIDKLVEIKEKGNINLSNQTKCSIMPKINFENKSFFAKLIYKINKRIKNFTSKLDSFYN